MWKGVGIAMTSAAATVLVAELALSAGLGDLLLGPPARADYSLTEEERARMETLAEKIRRGAVGTRVINGFSQRYGWLNYPGEKNVDGRRIHIGAQGARGEREVSPQPQPGRTRVVCWGESFTFGSEVGDDETWPARLELQSEGALEVVNLGVPAWGTDQALLRFRDTRGTMNPDVALMGFLVENIARNVNQLRNLYDPSTLEPLVKPRFLLESDSLRLIEVPYTSRLEMVEAALSGALVEEAAIHDYFAPQQPWPHWSQLARLFVSRRSEHKRMWPKMWGDPAGEPFRVSVALLEAFTEEARAGGAGFAGVLVFPTQTDLAGGGMYWDTLHRALQERGIPYLDLFETLRDLQGVGRQRCYSGNHLTPEANAVCAVAIGNWIERATRD